MEVDKRVKVISAYTFSNMTGTITAIARGTLGITVRLDEDGEEYPFNEDELEVIG